MTVSRLSELNVQSELSFERKHVVIRLEEKLFSFPEKPLLVRRNVI